MSNNGFDASIGLAFSLELFKHYQRTGVVQAELPRVPGIRGHCKAFLQLIDGEVISVYLEDKRGNRYSSDAATLCRLDEEKGPFEWQLHFQSQPTYSFPSVEPSTGKPTTSILSSDPFKGNRPMPRAVGGFVLPTQIGGRENAQYGSACLGKHLGAHYVSDVGQ